MSEDLWNGVWSARVWLPRKFSWSDFASNGTITTPQASDLIYSIGIGCMLLFIRLIFECFVVLPIASFYGQLKKPLLSRIYKHITGGFFTDPEFKRVSEAATRGMYFLLLFVFGCCVLWQEPQFWDVKACWADWPRHHLSAIVKYYYLTELGFYIFLLLSCTFVDGRRSDFWIMTIHHLVAIALISVSFMLNLVRIGTLLVCCHDLADIFLDFGKFFRAINYNRTSTAVFVVFIVSWVITRLVYYPCWIIYTVLVDARLLIEPEYDWYDVKESPYMVPRVFVFLLVLLLLFHIYWTILIVQTALKTAAHGKVIDVREELSEREKLE